MGQRRWASADERGRFRVDQLLIELLGLLSMDLWRTESPWVSFRLILWRMQP
jgi:hypothetical protein